MKQPAMKAQAELCIHAIDEISQMFSSNVLYLIVESDVDNAIGF